MNWHARITARRAGALGILSGEARAYVFSADSRDAAQDEAIRRAHAEGLEHVMVRHLSEDALGYLPVCRNEVLPWFERHGATLDDAHSFRCMIELAERDRDGLAGLKPSWRKAGLWRQMRGQIEAADVLIAAMSVRLSAILGKGESDAQG